MEFSLWMKHEHKYVFTFLQNEFDCSIQWRHNERDGVLKSPAWRLFTQPFIQGADQRKHQRSASLAFVRGINRWLVTSPHKGLVTRKIFPFDDVMVMMMMMIMI